ncbi:MAG: hypothetical protein CME60_08585 [Halobacteriovoraceae bacterium]|nr:hypothetical protein [Halobacteriovoraceae bacterium]
MNQRVGKKFFSLLCLFVLKSTFATSTLELIPDQLDFKELKKLESRMYEWVQKTGKEDLVQISQMSQRPSEVELIEFLFPHLLPENYKGRSLYLNCFHLYDQLSKKKDRPSYDKWKQCVLYDYRQPEDYMQDIMSKIEKQLKK